MEHDFYLFLSGKSNEFNVLLPYLLKLYEKAWSAALVDISFTNNIYKIKEDHNLILF